MVEIPLVGRVELTQLQDGILERLRRDLAAVSDRLAFTYYDMNIAASQSAVELPATNQDPLNVYVTMPYAGSVVAISANLTEARTAGTLTADATINGTATGLQAIIDDSPTNNAYATQAVGTDTFSAGDRIGVKLTTDASWTPTSSDLLVAVFVEI